MDEARINALFERYREDGEIEAIGALFDLAAPELLALAVRLVPTIGEAEDLVQIAFVALLERPRAVRPGARLMPFLVGILARQASKARRSARRKPNAARLPHRDGEAPEARLLSAELDASLRDALERVPEIYREVLRQHLVEGRRPIEIAVRLGRTPGTVGTQILRGLESLRRVLPRGLALGVAPLVAARGEAAVRSVVIARAHELAATSLAMGTSIPVLGGLFVSTKVTLATAALCAVLVFWLAWRTDESAVASLELSRSTSTDADSIDRSDPLRPPQMESIRSVSEPALAEGPAPATMIEIELPPRVVREVTLVARLSEVSAKHWPEFTLVVERSGAAPIEASFDGEGIAQAQVGPLFPDPTWGSNEPLSVRAKHPLYLDEHELVRIDGVVAAEHEPTRLECVLTPRRASALSGRVLVPPGVDPRSVRINLRNERGEWSTGAWLGRGEPCNEDGRYHLKLSAQGLHQLLATSPATLPFEVWVVLETAEHLELPDIQMETGSAEIRGVVHLPEGAKPQDIGEIAVHAYRRGAPLGAPHPRRIIDRGNVTSFGVLRNLREGPPPEHQVAALDAEHRFVLQGIDAGLWELEVHGVAASALLPLRTPRLVTAPASEVVLWNDRCFLTVEVVDPSGPVKNAEVIWSYARGEGQQRESQQTITDDAGRVSVIGDGAIDYALAVRAPGGTPTESEWPAFGRNDSALRRIELETSRTGNLLLRLAPGSVELTNVRLRLAPKAEDRPVLHLSAGLAGRSYRFDHVEPGLYRARVGPTDDRGPAAFYGELVQIVEFEVEITAAATCDQVVSFTRGGRVRIELRAEPETYAWLGAMLYGPDGLRRDFIGAAKLDAGEGFGTFASMDGALHLGASNAIEEPLPAGRYELRVEHARWTLDPTVFEIRVGEVTSVTTTARGH